MTLKDSQIYAFSSSFVPLDSSALTPNVAATDALLSFGEAIGLDFDSDPVLTSQSGGNDLRSNISAPGLKGDVEAQLVYMPTAGGIELAWKMEVDPPGADIDYTVIVSAEQSDQILRVENKVWAASYNFLAVPAAAMGLIAPWGAAIGMSLSSLLVVANALRLRGRSIDY